MRRLKVYLDTSVISYLQQEDAPERMRETLQLWEQFEEGEFDIFISRVTLDELDRCPEPKRSLLYGFLEKIQFSLLEIEDEVDELAQKIIDMGVLTSRALRIVSISRQR